MPDSESAEFVAGDGLLPGFAWPVPRAFAAAVSALRFEQGDVLLRDPAWLAQPSGPWPSGDWSAVQIQHPPRSAPMLGAPSDRRQASWDSAVELECVDLGAGRAVSRETTQGRLFTTWWRGDARWLEPDSPPPPLPLSARELQAGLVEHVEGLRRRARRRRIRNGSFFALAVDEASDASRAKRRSVAEGLAGLGARPPIRLPPAELALEAADRFAPTLQVVLFVVPERTPDEVEAALRPRLYQGQSAAAKASEPAPDDPQATSKGRFSASRHGVLESLSADAS